MKTIKPLKALFATTALLLTAGAVYAQPATVSGTFAMTTHNGTTATAWTCGSNSIDPSSFISVDQNYTDPSLSLAYLFGVQIQLPAGPISCSDGSHSEVLGNATQGGSWLTSLYSVDDKFPGGIEAIAPVSMDGDLTNGFTVTYRWGDSSCGTADAAGPYFGSHSGTVSNPSWDWAQLVVVVDAAFVPQSISLTTRECLGSGVYADTVYTLTSP